MVRENYSQTCNYTDGYNFPYLCIRVDRRQYGLYLRQLQFKIANSSCLRWMPKKHDASMSETVSGLVGNVDDVIDTARGVWRGWRGACGWGVQVGWRGAGVWVGWRGACRWGGGRRAVGGERVGWRGACRWGGGGRAGGVGHAGGGGWTIAALIEPDITAISLSYLHR